MSHQVIKMKLTLIFTIYLNLFSSIKEQSSSISVTQAFLFHQIQPAPSPYSSFFDNSSSSHDSRHQNRFSTKSTNLNSDSNHRLHTHASYLTRDTSIDYQDSNDKLNDCPIECDCNSTTLIADCSNKNLDRVPSAFPKDIKRISLQRNNITELGPHAFQGLRRLQRIDLSNNNLFKIDPLAFAGGLQSLNSLILYSNKLSQLPVNLFTELSQLQLLLLNDNALQCVHKELFQSLENLNLLSLYDNKIETLSNGTFDGLKNIKTIHLGKNPLVCDCNLRWLAEYLELRPTIETSEARCDGKTQPAKNQGKRLNQVSKQKFKCEGNDLGKVNQCNAQVQDQSCPVGCNCSGSTVDCSRTSPQQSTESRAGAEPIYTLPDVPDDVPVYVTRMRISDPRIKRIRQTGLFRRLANSQKLDLGNNKIIDIEDNAINQGAASAAGGGPTPKPERVVFVLVENNLCAADGASAQTTLENKIQQLEDGCFLAPKVNPPNFDSPCYNGGSCVSTSVGTRSAAPISTNYSCLCPPGFSGPLCEINIDDCAEHQCQNGALCVDGVNSYKCICRDPSTTGEFCEQLSPYSTNSANSIAPIALPIIASGNNQNVATEQQQQQQQQQQVATVTSAATQPQILTRSADLSQPPVDLSNGESGCKRVTQRKYYDDGNGCQSVRVLKMSECLANPAVGDNGCCQVAKVKRRRVRMQCSDGASYVKTIDLVKKCAWSSDCSNQLDYGLRQSKQRQRNHYNLTMDDQFLHTTRLDE